MTPVRLLHAFIRPSFTNSSIVRQVTVQPERKNWLSRLLAYIDEGLGASISVKGAGPSPTFDANVHHKPSAAGAQPAIQAHKVMHRIKNIKLLLMLHMSAR